MAEVYTGVCVGGPLDSRTVTVRTPHAFLAASALRDVAYVYRRGGDGRFVVSTDHDDSMQYPYGPSTGARTLHRERAEAAAANGELDVISIEAVTEEA